jgi:hypothetical protein
LSTVNLRREDIKSLAVLGTDLFAGTGFGGISRSTDQGANWVEVDSGLTNPTNYYVSTLAVKGHTIYAGTADGVFYSNDSGAHWIEIDSGMPEDKYISSLFVAGDRLLAATGHGALLSFGNGERWSNFDLGLSQPTQAQCFGTSGTDLLCGTSNSGVWRMPLSSASIKKERRSSINKNGPLVHISVRLRRNPIIGFSLPYAARVMISIYDLSGKKVTTLLSCNVSEGMHEISWNGRNLPSGCYTVQIQTELTTAAAQFLLVR